MISITMPGNVRFILDMLHRAGHEAYIVGGCVRDSVMGREPHDWDICTSAKPEQVIEIFNHFKVIPTGLKHGTVTIVKNDKQYEITTYRIDGEYDDARHPKNVTFTTSLKEDLSRRDFTINAMAYNDQEGIVDIFGGIEDISNKTIRCVGDAEERFSEDALRIMRAMRFAIRYGFDIEEQTFAAMLHKTKLLSKISAERINSELTQIIMGESSVVAMMLCRAGSIFTYLFPQLKEVAGSYVNNIMHSEPIKEVRLALLFDLPEEKLKETLFSLRYDNDTISNVLHIKTYGQAAIDDLKKNEDIKYFIKRMMRDIGYENTLNALFYSLAYSRAELNKEVEILYLDMQTVAMEVERKNECYKLSQLALNGNDIKRFGYKGKEIGVILNYLLEMVIKGVLKNDKEILEKRVEEIGGMQEM